ncbi:MAG: hypothetical protein JXR56_03045 [Candidatus Cloacimonetes bacterium]|nr:hypothetical protein [Candidatus Cloacimonadota bacterium]
MLKRTINLLTLTIVALLFSSCSQKMTKEDAVSFFKENETTFLEINKLLVSHQDIESVKRRKSELADDRYELMNKSDQDAYVLIRDKILEMRIKGVYVISFSVNDNKETPIIHYVLKHSSLFEKKAYKMHIVYVKDKECVSEIETLMKVQLLPLDVVGWYVMEIPWK